MFGTEFLLTGLPMATLLGGFLESNLIGKVIVLLQIAAFIVAGGIIIGKNQELISILSNSKRFLRDFLAGRDVLDYYLLLRKEGTLTSLELIYDRTCDRMVKLLDPDIRRSVIGRQGSTENAALSGLEIGLVRCTCEHTVQDEMIRVKRGMGVLAAIVVASPAVGLMGTAWGALDALAELSGKDALPFSAIALALSSALVTTVAGLLVAIPCAIFYYQLVLKLRHLSVDMKGFADELMGRIACEFQGRND